MLNDIIMTPVRITRTQNKCNTTMTQLSPSIGKAAEENIEEEKEEAER